jgi:hypothetical protein
LVLQLIGLITPIPESRARNRKLRFYADYTLRYGFSQKSCKLQFVPSLDLVPEKKAHMYYCRYEKEGTASRPVTRPRQSLFRTKSGNEKRRSYEVFFPGATHPNIDLV